MRRNSKNNDAVLSGNSHSLFAFRQFIQDFYRTMFESYMTDPFVRRFVPSIYFENENPSYREAVHNTYNVVMKDATLWEIEEDWRRDGKINDVENLASMGWNIHSVAEAIASKEDRNLVLFFSYIRDDLVTANNNEPFQNPFEENDTINEKAEAIRAWMRENQDILNRIAVISLWLNPLFSIPKEISLFTNLQTLALSDCGIRFLTPEIGSLRNLKVLVLDYNLIPVIPPEIGNLTNLKELSFRENGLTVLPPEIGNLINLQILMLEINGIVFLPPEIGRLVDLRSFGLADNPLASLPLQFIELQQLESLTLDAIGDFEGIEEGQPIDWSNLPIAQIRPRACLSR